MKRLLRSEKRIIAGICGGVGNYLNLDPNVVRIITVILTILTGGGALLVYLVAWLLLKNEESSEP